jgi:hypothetical protein
MITSPEVEKFINHFKKLELVVNVTATAPNEFLVKEVKDVYNVTEPLVVITFVIKKSDGGTTTFKSLVPISYCDDKENFYNNVEFGIKKISENDQTLESLLFQNPITNKTVPMPEQETAAIENPDSNLQDLINRLKELPNVLKVDAHNVIDPTILENVNSDSGIVVKVMATFRNVNDKSFDNIYDVVLPKETYDDPTVRDTVVKNFTDYITNINM